MWMIVCFLKSQCKNKVTNRADSKCNLPRSMEKEEGHVMSGNNPNHMFESHLKDTAEEVSVHHLHVLDLNNRDIENSRIILIQSPQSLQSGNKKTEDELARFAYSGLKAEKSVREGIPKCLSAPILLPYASKSSKGAVLRAEEPIILTATKVLPDVTASSTEDSIPAATEVSREPLCPTKTSVHSDMTILLNKDSTHPEATQLSCDMTGLLSINTASILPADKCSDFGIKLNTNAEVNQKTSRESHENFNDETDLVQYFETRIELMGTMGNQTHVAEEVIKEDLSSQEKHRLSKFEISKTFGKKSKTWTSFYDSENHSVHLQPESELESIIPFDVHNSSMIDTTEETFESNLRKQVKGECSNIANICSSDDQSHWKFNDHLSDCLDIADELPGPSNAHQRQRARNKQHQALQHAQMVKERLWKYHRNCCDEYQPCKAASKVLKKIKALEKTQFMQKTKQSPPSDEDLLEGKPSPLLPSTLSKDCTLAKPGMVSKMTCASLPNLSQYDNRQLCASHDASSLKSPVQIHVNVDDNIAIVITSPADLALPDISVAHGEHQNASYNLNLAVLGDQSKRLVRSEMELNNVSPSTLTLPNDDAPAVYVVEGKVKLNDRLVNNLSLPIINAQTEAKRPKNLNNLSASQLELPTICEPSLSGAVQKTSLENMKTKKVYLPVVDFHKTDLVKSLPAIKMLEGDNVRDSQSVKPSISSNKIITKTDPKVHGKLYFEKQDLQLNLEIKTQKSQTLNEPDADGVFTNEVNMTAIRSTASCPLVEMIPNHGKVTTGENVSTHTHGSHKCIEFVNVSRYSQTNLTTSVSYSNSTQDGEEVSDWPKICDLVKHSSTISLSSNFDILNHPLVPYFNAKHENLYDESNKSNTDLSFDKCQREETMENQLYDIDDHRNMGLSFKCPVLQHHNIEIDDRKSTNGMENEIFYIQDETSQHYEDSSDEKVTLRILDGQSILEDQPDINSHVLENAEKAQSQMEPLERIKVICHKLDLHIINDTVDHISYKDNTQTSNLEMVVKSRPDIQTRSKDPCRNQTEETYANGQMKNHKGYHLTTSTKEQEDLSNDVTDPPNAKTKTGEAEVSQPQTNMNDIRDYSDISTTVITDEGLDFERYKEELNERVCRNLCIVDIHVAETFEDISNICQDTLSSDSTSASDTISTSAGSTRRNIVGTETSSDGLKTEYENDDSRGSEHKFKKNDSFDESTNALRKALGDVPNCVNVCNSDAAFNDGQENRGEIDVSLCNTEMTEKMSQQLIGIQKFPKPYSKQTWNNQKSKTDRPLKTVKKVPPANANDKPDLKDYLSRRVSKRPFHSVFTFLAKASNTEEGEAVKNSTIEEDPSDGDSDPTKTSLVLSDRCNKNVTMEAVEYLTYLYARSPKPKACPGSVEGLKIVSDLNDISVLANLHFCKVALPGEFVKPEMATDVQKVYVDQKVEPVDPSHEYVPPSKKELEADDELAVLHVIYTLKRSLELTHNEMERD